MKVQTIPALACLEYLSAEIAQDHPLKAEPMHQKTEKATAISMVADTALPLGPDSPDFLNVPGSHRI